MKIKILFLIIVLAACLRFFMLGTNPPSLDWDEASMGYNAYSILKTGADEYGNKFPLAIRSFDDYKPALYTYLTVPSVAAFGLNEFAVRLPAALIGMLGVLVTYYLAGELLDTTALQYIRKKTIIDIPLLSAFFLAISPWDLQFSRAAFEAQVGVVFFIIGLLFFLKGLRKGWYFVLSDAAFILSLYSYHSFRLLVPLLICTSIILFWRQLLVHKKTYLLGLGMLIIASLPIAASFIGPAGSGARLSMVTIFSDPDTLSQSLKDFSYAKAHKDYVGMVFSNRRFVYANTIMKGYLDHFSPDFLFLHGDSGRQHHAVDMGMLYLWDLPFVVLGIFLLLSFFTKKIQLLFIWFLLSPLPAALTTGTPHPVRAIAMIPAFQIFIAVGIAFTISYLLQKKSVLIKYGAIGIVVGLFLINVTYYFHQYYIVTPRIYGFFWQYGYKDAFAEAKTVETKYNKIIVTYAYDQPYIYYLFYNKIDPATYQKEWDTTHTGQDARMSRTIGKYEFRKIDWGNDKKLTHTLVIGSPDEIPANAANIIKNIYFPDGSIAFRVVSL